MPPRFPLTHDEVFDLKAGKINTGTEDSGGNCGLIVSIRRHSFALCKGRKTELG